MKQCSKCKQLLVKDQFCKSKNMPDGLCAWCTECVVIYNKEYRRKNREQVRKYRKEYVEIHKDELKEWYKQYRQENIDRISEYHKKYDQENVEQLIVQHRKYRQKNAEEIAGKRKKYDQENAERIKKRKKEYDRKHSKREAARRMARHAAKLQRTPKWLTLEQKQQIIDSYINCPEGMEVDHIYPLQGRYVSGLHHPDNLQYLTKSENSSKGNKYPEVDNFWKEEENIG